MCIVLPMLIERRKDVISLSLAIYRPADMPLAPEQSEQIRTMCAFADHYITLGTTLKHHRDSLARYHPGFPGSKDVGEADNEKANIMGVESLLAYLVAFSAMDRAYELEGGLAHRSNKGRHWSSLFPYLDSFREGLQSCKTDEKNKVVLAIVASLVGYRSASCLAVVHNAMFERYSSVSSAEEMACTIREQTANFKRRELMGDTYRRKCLEVAKRWPEMISEGKALAWITTAFGFGFEEAKVKLSAIVKELIVESRVGYGTLDF